MVTESKNKEFRTLAGCQFLLFISQVKANPIPLMLGLVGAKMQGLAIRTAQF